MDLFAGHQAQQVAVEARQVHGFDMLVVQIAGRVARIAGVTHEVAVGGDQDGAVAVDAQVGDEPFGEGGLAGRGGAGDQNEPHGRRALRDGVGDAGEFLVVQRLDRMHEVVGALLKHRLVEFADGGDADDLAPRDMLLVDREEVFVGRQRRQFARVRGGRHIEHEAAAVGDQVEQLQQAGARHQRLLAQLEERAALRQTDDRRITMREQVQLVGLPRFTEETGRGLVGDRDRRDGEVLADGLQHRRLEAFDVGVERSRREVGPLHRAVEAGADRVAHAALDAGIKFMDGLGQKEAERGAVDIPAVGVLDGERRERRVGDQRHEEREHHVVGDRAQDGEPVAVDRGQQVADARAGRDHGRGLSVDGYGDGVHDASPS